MRQDEIMEMAIKAHYESKTWIDIYKDGITAGTVRGYLEAFAKLVAEKEREAVAEHIKQLRGGDEYSEFLAELIRARGQA
jgi:ferritin-like protein